MDIFTRRGRDPNEPGLDRIMREAVRHDFPVNMLCWGNLDAGTALIVSGLAEQQLSGDQRPSKVVNNKGAVVGPFVVLSDGV